VKKLTDIKFGGHIVDTLNTPRFFADIVSRTSLDHKTLQRALDSLMKHGHITKSVRGEWRKL
jgi:DNA-binding HxlR family transcriptional regulator